MELSKDTLQTELERLEAEMNSADFWQDKDKAQRTLRRIQEVKAEIAGEGKYDAGDAVMTIFSGAGGDDAEDFSAMLLSMYLKFFEKHNFSAFVLHKSSNDTGVHSPTQKRSNRHISNHMIPNRIFHCVKDNP